MRCYGNVKGRKYYAVQPTPEDTSGKKKCERCKKYKPPQDFVGRDRLDKRYCKDCRKEITERRYRNDPKDLR